jgi:hypothetical protein
MFVWNKFIYTNKIKPKLTTLSEQLQQFNRKSVETSKIYTPNTHPGLAKGLQNKVVGLNVWT